MQSLHFQDSAFFEWNTLCLRVCCTLHHFTFRSCDWLTDVHDYDKHLATRLGEAWVWGLRLSLNWGLEPRTECMLQAPPSYWPRHKCKLYLWTFHKLLFFIEHFKLDKESALPMEWDCSALQSESYLINHGTGYWERLQIVSLKGS